MENEILIAALEYCKKGFSVIPLGVNKKPLLESWKEFQNRRATEEEVRSWFKTWPNANVGIVTGQISGFVAVDVEKEGSTEGLIATVISETGGGGFHYLYLRPKNGIKNSTKKIRPYTDIRGDGGYIMAPPSIHPSGNRYKWKVSFDMAEMVELPEWVLKAASKTKVNWKETLEGKTLKGGRNSTAAQVAGKILLQIDPDKWDTVGLPLFKQWNKEHNIPPLDDSELFKVWESIKNRELQKRLSKVPQKEQLLSLLDDPALGIELFHDEFKERWANININGHKENWQCNSSSFRLWLSKLFYEAHGKAPNTDAVKSALGVIESKAQFEGKEYKLFNRVALDGQSIWYDLADPNWNAVKITADGWTIEQPPILFRRFNHQNAQVMPQRGGKIDDFLKYVNIQDRENQLLLLVHLVCCFIPGFPHPLLSIHGPQGSAKSVMAKLIKKIVDPSGTEVLSFPKDVDGLIQLLDHNWLVFFDNLSRMPEWISDQLCKAVTGDGFSKRKLYTDNDDIIYNFQRPIGINGINLVITKPDLLERSILVELDRIAPENRRTEKDIWKNFEAEKPFILGAIFDIVSNAMRIQPGINLPYHPRMADYAIWSCAVAESIGYKHQDFLDAYQNNLKKQNDEVLNESPVAIALRAFLNDRADWEGSATELLTLLGMVGQKMGIETYYDREWPKAANVLSRILNILKTSLANEGIYMNQYASVRGRIIHLHNTKGHKTAQNDIGDNNDIIRPSTALDEGW